MNEETNDPDYKKRLDWHSGFEGGLKLSLKNYDYDIAIEREHFLSGEPLRIDFLVVKKNTDVIIDNDIGRGFLVYNLIEYKNPYDELNIDVLWRTIGYAALYKSFGETVDRIKITDITISIFRAVKPVKLFKELIDTGKSIVQEYTGVYVIKGIIDIPVRVIVTDELTDRKLMAFSIMSQNATEQDIRQFVQDACKLKEPGDRRSADAVLQISANLHRELYSRLRGDEAMCEALRELMADDLREAESKGIEKGIERRDYEKIMEMLKDGKTPEAIVEFCKYPMEQVLKVQDEMLIRR